LRYATPSPTILGKKHWDGLPILINGGFEICVIREEVTRQFNIERKHSGWMMITADGNQSDVTKVAVSLPVNVQGIIIPVPFFVATSTSEEDIPGNLTLETIRRFRTMAIV
jgi:hypothetical protein